MNNGNHKSQSQFCERSTREDRIVCFSFFAQFRERATEIRAAESGEESVIMSPQKLIKEDA
jgi:hypothetical protein